MIQKVLPGEYLTGYEKMTNCERKAWRKRVGEWLRSDGERLLALTDRPMAQAQNLMQMSVRWSKEDCRSLHDGAVLLTALMGVTDTWLPGQLWSKSAWRAVRKIVLELTVIIQNSKIKIQNGADAKNENRANVPALPATNKPNLEQPVKVSVPSLQGRAGGGSEMTGGGPAAIPVRPKHIDQYLHLLPANTQEKGAMVRGLLRELDDAREKARLLMGTPQASPASIAAWAKKAAKIDEQLKSIYHELDSEWEKLVQSGRVVVDELGNAHVMEVKSEELRVKNESNPEPLTLNPEPAKRGRKPMTEEEKAAKNRQENQRKAALIRKWLIDTRNSKTKEQVKKWKAKYKQMVKLGGQDTVTQKVKEAAEFYGITLK